MLHPDHLLAQLTSSQVTEWLAYLDLEDEDHWEEEKARIQLSNHRAGLVCATVANFGPVSKKRDFRPSDFVGGGSGRKSEDVADKLRAAFEGMPGAKKVGRRKSVDDH